MKTTRWSRDEWSEVLRKAKAARVNASEYVRAKALNMPPMMMRWKGLRPSSKTA